MFDPPYGERQGFQCPSSVWVLQGINVEAQQMVGHPADSEENSEHNEHASYLSSALHYLHGLSHVYLK